MSRELTDLQKAFLSCLFDKGVDGDPAKAKAKAGYSVNTPTSDVVNSLEEEILEVSRKYLTSRAAKAVVKLESVLDSPASLGAANAIAAAKDLLDRAGLVKPEKLQIDMGGGVMILPQKRNPGE